MNVKRRAVLRAFAGAAALPSLARAQGFAGLGSSAEGFALPQPDPQFRFPADHGAHPDYRVEWWYVTAVLTGTDGAQYGLQWTLFRSALAPRPGQGWTAPQIWFAHAGVTTKTQHFSAERRARGGIGQAGVQPAPFTAWIDEWEMRSQASPEEDAFDALSLKAQGRDFAYDLALHASSPLVLQGQNGYSVKSPEGQASYYYAQPFFTAQGALDLPQGKIPVTGQAWLDREWSSQPLAADQSGWDWFALHLQNGAKLMLFQLRDGGAGYRSGNWIAPDGTNTPLSDGKIRLTPQSQSKVQGRMIPTSWRIELPAQGLDITSTPLNPQAWMDTAPPYWEGPITVTGSHPGRGYLEMTGYD
ncbi:MAG: iron ABC transporter permease [Mangrovicoccus sp.]|nr:iron ABC transporter permease [Mangrovicoccus sp.]